MCFFVYSPNRKINVQFSTESISLSPFGSSKIIVDMLVENKSDNNFDELVFLYPNCFYKIKQRIKKGKVKLKFLKFGEYANISDEIIDQDNITNITYHQSGVQILISDENADDIIFRLPNPHDLSNPHEFVGKIYEGSKNIFTLFPSFTDKTLKILEEIRFSIFQLKFGTPIAPNDKRWIRLSFTSKKSAIYYSSKMRLLVIWFINMLKFNYHIMGPSDCLHIFKERLAIYNHTATEKIKENQGQNNKIQFKGIQQSINELQRKIIEPLNKSSTIYNNLYLHIFSGKLRTLESIYSWGNIYPNGTMPNYLTTDNNKLSSALAPSWKLRVYDWICEAKKYNGDASFNLCFTGHSANRFMLGILLLIALSAVFKILIIPMTITTLSYYNLEDTIAHVIKIEDFIFKDHPAISFSLPILYAILWPVISGYILKIKSFLKRQ